MIRLSRLNVSSTARSLTHSQLYNWSDMKYIHQDPFTADANPFSGALKCRCSSGWMAFSCSAIPVCTACKPVCGWLFHPSRSNRTWISRYPNRFWAEALSPICICNKSCSLRVGYLLRHLWLIRNTVQHLRSLALKHSWRYRTASRFSAGLRIFCQHILQPHLIQTLIRHLFLQPGVLFFELHEPFHVARCISPYLLF